MEYMSFLPKRGSDAGGSLGEGVGEHVGDTVQEGAVADQRGRDLDQRRGKVVDAGEEAGLAQSVRDQVDDQAGAVYYGPDRPSMWRLLWGLSMCGLSLRWAMRGFRPWG
jgi:hypothetical protein